MKKYNFIMAIVNLILVIIHILQGTTNWAIFSTLLALGFIILYKFDKEDNNE